MSMTPSITRKQWDLFNEATSIALTLVNSKLVEYKSQGYESAVYEGWLEEVREAKLALQAISAAMPFEVWYAKEEVAA